MIIESLSRSERTVIVEVPLHLQVLTSRVAIHVLGGNHAARAIFLQNPSPTVEVAGVIGDPAQPVHNALNSPPPGIIVIGCRAPCSSRYVHETVLEIVRVLIGSVVDEITVCVVRLGHAFDRSVLVDAVWHSSLAR